MTLSPELKQAVEAFQRGELGRALAIAEGEVGSADSPQWHHLLGVIHCRLGDPERGVEHLRSAAEAEPANAAFQLMLVRALVDSGCAAEVLAMPEPPPIASAAGLALWQARAEAADVAGDQAAAAQIWRAIARAHPQDCGSWIGLGRSLLRLEDYAEAERAYLRALEISPGEADAFHELGLLYDRINQIERLSELLNRASEAGVEKHRLALLWVIYEQRRGNFDEARELLSKADASRDPIRWHRLKARIEDRAGTPAAAFSATVAMNRATPDFDGWRRRAARYRGQLRGLAKALTKASAAQLPSLGQAAHRTPVFLVGFPRSGTTLLDTFLLGHPDIVVLEEQPLLFDASEGIGPMAGLGDCPKEDLQRARETYSQNLSKLLDPDFTGVVVDKFPLNMLAAPAIHALFPGAPIIFAQRHPCDCVLSGFMQAFVANLGMASFLDLADAADFYDSAMSVWSASRAVLPINVHTVVYEELVAGPQATLRPVIEFLGLQWDERVLDHRTTAIGRGPIGNTSYDQVTEPLTSDPVFRWRRYREQLQPVLPLLLPWAERLGYDS